MRIKIIEALKQSPANMNQLAERLGVNYRTISHHLKVLEENGILVSEGPRYGKVYFLERSFEENFSLFQHVISGELKAGVKR